METEEEKAAREATELKKAEEEKLALQKKQEEEDLLKKSEDRADKLLDGTDPNKKITIKKTAYDERNEKAKLYEAHAELLDEVLKDPDTVRKFVSKRKDDDVGERLARLEEERKSEKRAQMKDAVSEMLERFEGFEKSWGEVRPIAESLMAQGFSPRESMRRGFIAVNPQAAQSEHERMAREAQNREGEMRGGGLPPRLNKTESALSTEEKLIAQKLIKQGTVKSEDDYAKLLEKHKGWIEKQLRNIGEF